MYSTRTRVNARIPNWHPREEKRASGQKSGRQVGEEVGVGVRVRVGPVEFSFIQTYNAINSTV